VLPVDFRVSEIDFFMDQIKANTRFIGSVLELIVQAQNLRILGRLRDVEVNCIPCP
jgi:hypothetical protein